MKTKEAVWTVPIVEDPDDPQELLLTLPDGLLQETGWTIGDVLQWKELQNGTWSLNKKKSRTSVKTKQK